MTLAFHQSKASRLQALLDAMSQGLYEREHALRLCLLATLAGESVFLLGPPGIAKSQMARRLRLAFTDARYFEYLMTRFSTPEEVFGPLSLQALKDEGRYIRLTEGYLPEAEMVFLDEIWKAGPAILNTLLTVTNERTFKNGNQISPVPLRVLITASNELPEQDSGLGALYDRMLVRLHLQPIENKYNFRAMLRASADSSKTEIPEKLKIHSDEYETWQKQIQSVSMPESVFEQLYQLKQQLEQAMNTSASDAPEQQSQQLEQYYLSDRRWKRAYTLLQASALFNDRVKINALDLLLLTDCLWHTPTSRTQLLHLMRQFAKQQLFGQEAISDSLQQLQNQLDGVQDEITAVLASQFQLEKRLNVEQFRFNYSQLKTSSVSHESDLYTAVILSDSAPLSDKVPHAVTRLRLRAGDLEKAMRKGQGSVYGYIDNDSQLCQVHLLLDAANRLMVKDTDGHPVPAALLTIGGISQTQHGYFAQWRELIEQGEAPLAQAEQQLQQAMSELQQSSPHLFISPAQIEPIRASLEQLSESLSLCRRRFQQQHKRLQRIQDGFELAER